jgi:hypothetical protein
MGGTAGRLLLWPGLVLGPVLVAVVGLGVAWWLPIAALAGAALAFLALAGAAARRDARDPSWASFRCAGCGALVPAGAVACPRCHSLDVGDQWALLRHDRPAERHRALQSWAARKREQRRQYAAWGAENPEWAGVFRFLAADLAMLGQAYVRFLASGMSLDPDDPADMRWWAAALLLLAGGFGLLAAAGHFHAWGPGLAVLLPLLAGSAAVAVAGPRAMAERDPAAGAALAPEVREAAAALGAEVNAGTGPDLGRS